MSRSFSVVVVGAVSVVILAVVTKVVQHQHPLPSEVIAAYGPGGALVGKTVVVTGANAGIGFETASAFATTGANVVLACRSPPRCKSAARVIRASAAVVPKWHELDLDNFRSIERFAANLTASHSVIHALVLNAGVTGVGWLEVRRSNSTGQELRWGTNHVGHHYLVTLLQQPLLAVARAAEAGKENSRARVIVVSSRSHRFSPVLPTEFEQLPTAEMLQPWPPVIPVVRDLRLYGFSKLCNVLFAKELQRRWGDEILAVSLHPGSSMLTNGGESAWPVRLWLWLMSPWAKTPAQGASTTVYAALATSLHGGEYLSDCTNCNDVHPDVNDALKGKLLWEFTEALIGKISAM